MSLTPAQRITMIRESANLLNEWREIELVLPAFDVHMPGRAAAEPLADFVRRTLRDVSDETLSGVHQYLTSVDDTDPSAGPTPTGPWSKGGVRLFFSHLTAHKVLVQGVSEVLSKYGAEAFVAHEAIAPSAAWQEVIESALTTCDAMVAFLHPDFDNSRWCDQEVGWVLGRQRPILPLSFQQMPYGFLGKFQSKVLAPSTTAYPIATLILEWLVQQPQLQERAASGIARGFAESVSYDGARRGARLLEALPTLSSDDYGLIEKAAADNSQIRDAMIPTEHGASLPGPDWVRAYIEARLI
jgi:hypothetical protein